MVRMPDEPGVDDVVAWCGWCGCLISQEWMVWMPGSTGVDGQDGVMIQEWMVWLPGEPCVDGIDGVDACSIDCTPEASCKVAEASLKSMFFLCQCPSVAAFVAILVVVSTGSTADAHLLQNPEFVLYLRLKRKEETSLKIQI
eukprot:1160098-Pelagomonas_calceolata.AAC.11